MKYDLHHIDTFLSTSSVSGVDQYNNHIHSEDLIEAIILFSL